jgi:hypothetical protein
VRTADRVLPPGSRTPRTVPQNEHLQRLRSCATASGVARVATLGARPTTPTFDCRPFLNGNIETWSFTNPAARADRRLFSDVPRVGIVLLCS